jgi:hypothetical protein
MQCGVQYTTVYNIKWGVKCSVELCVGSLTHPRQKFRGVDFVFFLMVAFPGIFLGLIVLPNEERTVPEGGGEHVTGTLACAASA